MKNKTFRLIRYMANQKPISMRFQTRSCISLIECVPPSVRPSVCQTQVESLRNGISELNFSIQLCQRLVHPLIARMQLMSVRLVRCLSASLRGCVRPSVTASLRRVPGESTVPSIRPCFYSFSVQPGVSSKTYNFRIPDSSFFAQGLSFSSGSLGIGP